MRIAHILFSQGFGSRRQCAGLIAAGLVRVDGRVVDDAAAEFEPEGLVFEVEGRAWPYHAKALILLHKPPGYECSRKPRHHPSVMSLLPAPLRTRGVQPVGRLDADTTGLLLLTDDGALIHRLSSPRQHVPKVYEARTRHPLTAEQVQRLVDGVVLDDDPAPVRALQARATAPQELRLVLAQGRYHQVKRMIAAVGNRCEALHRSAFGALELPADLGPGQWRWIEPQAIVPPR
ncbi:MAG: 16S rRNA pseudouridine(516) synthase [Burkholderiales bacterium]|nr:16S rRNA pseudouridine(516) synthase [Burkholderiales bacterium]